MTEPIVVNHDAEHHRFTIAVDGAAAGMTEYQQAGDHLLAITHTRIEAGFEGRGLASQLISQTLEELRRQQLSVLPFCPFVKAFIAKNPEYLDLVPAESRDRFGLPH
jgi:predicted GNAT family acetyltransferase